MEASPNRVNRAAWRQLDVIYVDVERSELVRVYGANQYDRKTGLPSLIIKVLSLEKPQFKGEAPTSSYGKNLPQSQAIELLNSLPAEGPDTCFIDSLHQVLNGSPE